MGVGASGRPAHPKYAQGGEVHGSPQTDNMSTRITAESVGSSPEQWHWLVERPHPWRRQLWVKGRKLLASAVWLDALTNGMGPREAAENWDLPLEACEEIFAYCETNKALIEAE